MAKIYIDPGHNYSGQDTGAVGFGLKEQDVSVQIGVLLRDMLVLSGQTVKMSRENITDTISPSLNGSLAARYNNANSWGADIFISIHCNAVNTKAYGCETYYCEGSTQGAELAKAVQPHLAAETGRYNRGVKSANFAVIRHTNMPAILVETAFIDNYDDNKFLASENGRKVCAMAIYKGVCDYLGIEYNLESGDISMTMYEELKTLIKDLQEKNDKKDNIINLMGQEIVDLYNKYYDAHKIFNTVGECPEWAQNTIQNLIDSGKLKGDEEGNLRLTYDLMRNMVINAR